ncbi:hypothetical protein ABT144_29975 [Streptomyces sp. NPDC002039]|uniref:hypothetical protein n=1 Tax=Streptomyces sp. NPDC002039 TaxID=3154660 RepID=UPI00332364D7
MAKDSEAATRVWNSTAMLAHQRGRHTDAVAAAQAALSTTACRRDPLYAFLALARTAVGHANRRARQPALRSLGHAGEALAKARDEARPSWIAFYGPAELHALTTIVRDRLGDAAESEAASHRALSVLPHAVPPQPGPGHLKARPRPTPPRRHRAGLRHHRGRVPADAGRTPARPHANPAR